MGVLHTAVFVNYIHIFLISLLPLVILRRMRGFGTSLNAISEWGKRFNSSQMFQGSLLSLLLVPKRLWCTGDGA